MGEPISDSADAPATCFTLPILHTWLVEALSGLRAAREEIDALNVFPVPDGDTGTNLYLTVEAACTAFIEPCEDLAAAAIGVGRAAILGARGNSGVIFSALLRDLVAELAKSPENFAHALSQGASGAYRAVASPVEGTILTVATDSAQEAELVASRGADLAEVVTAAADAAYNSLLLTPDLLVQLRDAGVVDAGGRGLVVVLDALVTVLTGAKPQRMDHEVHPLNQYSPLGELKDDKDGDIECEVMYHFDAKECTELRNVLESLGTSVMVAGIDSLWKVHVHAPLHRVSDCINAGIARGIVTQVSVVPLDLHSNNRVHPESSVVRSRILIAVTHGQGIQRLLESLGVTCIPTPARQQPSAAEIIAAIKGSEAREIVILPSDRDTHPVADIAASDMRAMGYRVSVIPSRAITQSLAAIAVHEPSLEFDRDVVSMTRAASATRYGAITRATRDVLTMAGACKSGDYLGLIDGEISVIESELLTASKKLLRRMLAPGAELLTIVTGNELSESEIESFLTWVKSSYPLIDLELVSGEQPLWPFIFGVE
jgi:DAK2 domain fusion protein YloV